MAKPRDSRQPRFEQVPHQTMMGSARPKNVHERRVSEINTQTRGAGMRGGTTAGQGPALQT